MLDTMRIKSRCDLPGTEQHYYAYWKAQIADCTDYWDRIGGSGTRSGSLQRRGVRSPKTGRQRQAEALMSTWGLESWLDWADATAMRCEEDAEVGTGLVGGRGENRPRMDKSSGRGCRR